MYNVIIFGTGESSTFVVKLLNKQVNLLAYADNDKNKWGRRRNNIDIIEPNNIGNYCYDYIIIASQFNDEIYNQLIQLGIKHEQIFQYYKFLDNNRNYYKDSINRFINNLNDDIEIINTGISYSWTGFDTGVCKKKAYNFAYASQDLFFDYYTLKYLIENYKEKLSKLKYVIVGMCYYSFQYDMSLSAMRGKTILYYEILNIAHHFKDIEGVYKEYELNKQIADKLFRKRADGNYDFNWEVNDFIICNAKEEIGKKQAEIDCNKNYPRTVKEYTEIFKDYLKLLKKNNIKPIVVVFPATKYYTKYFSKRIEDEFKYIITETQKEYDFQYVDYFRSELFYDEDFKDVSHLNIKGAEKFTKILNELINW